MTFSKANNFPIELQVCGPDEEKIISNNQEVEGMFFTCHIQKNRRSF